MEIHGDRQFQRGWWQAFCQKLTTENTKSGQPPTDDMLRTCQLMHALYQSYSCTKMDAALTSFEMQVMCGSSKADTCMLTGAAHKVMKLA